jgi:Arc/MetJ family transcription regulator
MRTTLTLDDDVAAELEERRRAQGLTFKRAVNEALRRGLLAMSQGEGSRRPFATRSARLGAPRTPLDNVAEALAATEREDFR